MSYGSLGVLAKCLPDKTSADPRNIHVVKYSKSMIHLTEQVVLARLHSASAHCTLSLDPVFIRLKIYWCTASKTQHTFGQHLSCKKYGHGMWRRVQKWEDYSFYLPLNTLSRVEQSTICEGGVQNWYSRKVVTLAVEPGETIAMPCHGLSRCSITS